MELRQRKFEIGDLIQINWVHGYYAVVTKVEREMIHATITHSLAEERSMVIGSLVNVLKSQYDTVKLLSAR